MADKLIDRVKSTQQRLQGISVKVKLLVLLIVLPTFALVLYFSFAVKLFESDKIAYIFDSSATVSKTLASQTFTEVQSLSTLYRDDLDGALDSTNRFQSETAKSFREDKDTLWIGAYRMDDEGVMALFSESKNPAANQTPDAIGAKDAATEACANGVSLRDAATSTNPRLFLFSLCKKQEGRPATAVAMLSRSDTYFSGLRRQSLYSNYLVDRNGAQVFGPPNKAPEDFSYWSFFSTLQSRNLPSGTIDTTSPDNRRLLASFAKVGTGGYTVIAFIERKAALAAAETLFWKSLLFLLAIAAFSLIVSVFASNNLTVTLRDLDKATQVIAEGKFDINVPVRSGDELGRLAGSFNKMAVEVARLLAENQEYARGLERKVAERTHELNVANSQLTALLNSLGQGFLIFDKNGVCANIWSKACERILEAIPTGKNIWDILKIPQDKRGDYISWAEAIFEEMIPFDDLVGLAPKEYAHTQGHRIELEYFPMRNDTGTIAGIVLVATDRTREFEAEETAAREREYVQMVLKLIRAKQQFLSFTRETHDMVSAMREESHKPKPNAPALMRYMHTIKGGAALFGETEVRDIAHDSETWIEEKAKAQKLGGADFTGEIDERLDRIEGAQSKFFNTHKDLIGREYGDTERRTEVPIRKLVEMLQKIEKVPGSAEIARDFVEDFIKEPASNLLSHYNTVLDETAKRLGKEVGPLKIVGGDTRVLHSRYNELFSSFVHIFRNAVDHAVEDHKTRVEQGKPAFAQVTVEIQKDNRKGHDWLIVKISDDGRGIDAARVREKLISKGNKSVAQEGDAAVIQHIFDAGVSTKEAVTDLSGRGVGLDMVMTCAKDLGGSARVTTVPGKSTTFIIEVPETT